MRKIEELMVKAVNEQRNFKRSNTEVKFKDGVCHVKLFGNTIYYQKGNVKLYHDAGWPTMTTASRLRALGANILFKRGKYIKIIPVSKAAGN